MPRGRGKGRGPSKFFRNLQNESERGDASPAPPVRRPNLAIQQYLKAHTPTGTLPDWTQCPEVPTLENLFETVEEEVVNLVDQPWSSKLQYLKSQYLLLREDALRPLRHAVKVVQDSPHMLEDRLLGNLGLYDHVHVCGATLSSRGLALKVRFSLGRVGKNVHWDQSKRLLTGSLVILMSAENKDVCKLGVVAARPLVGLAKTPPEIDLFFFRAEDMDVDCQQGWIMIEERSTFFEAQRHTLVALQRLVQEQFPLSEHIVDLQKAVDAPSYISHKPYRDLSSVFRSSNIGTLPAVDVLNNWPEDPETALDNSQQMAMKQILTKKLSIVQGPPGTGKTFVSVQALRAILDNHRPEDPPIIVACQTNHALDQLLRHVALFEPLFARLGGRSKDTDVIKKRTVYELRQQVRIPNTRGFRSIKTLGERIANLLSPLAPEQEMIELKDLQEHGILTEEQCDSLEKNADEWVSQDDVDGQKTNPLRKWLGNQIKPRKLKKLPDLIDFEEGDDDVNYEDIQEQEAETAMAGVGDEDEQYEILRGPYVEIGDKWTGSGVYVSDFSIAETLRKHSDLRKIPASHRGIIYQYLQKKVKENILKRLRETFPLYADAVQERKIANLEIAEIILREQRVVGVTTTGLAKYRSLISSLKPKVMLIEEAAETLEAPVVAACVGSLEHLILVGDHKQLRPHCNVAELENPPYNLNISLFERLVQNGVEFSLLNQQRRMVPEIRRLLRPVYGNVIVDHPAVLERSPVPGMGGLSTWFFTHDFPDERDNESSSFNMKEVDMIVGLVQYLSYNGVEGKDITILTFYNGQRRKLIYAFARTDFWKERLRNMKIVTVDSYQGEENGVVILSLVRSNEDGKIGFVGVENRVCVALSRAQRGLYIFGNGELLCGESKIWLHVLRMLRWGQNAENPRGRRLGFRMPIQCEKHGRKVFIRDEGEWAFNVGGCEIRCNTRMECGHICHELCHPWDHAIYACKYPCDKLVPGCGHKCFRPCFEPCWCMACEKQRETSHNMALASAAINNGPPLKPESVMPTEPGVDFIHPGVKRWREFAEGGVKKQDRELARSRESRASDAQLAHMDDENSKLLFADVGSDDEGQTEADDQVTLLSTAVMAQGNVRHRWHQKYSVAGTAGTGDLDTRTEAMSLLDAPIPGEGSMAVGADAPESAPQVVGSLLDGTASPAFGGWDKSPAAPAGLGWDAAPTGGSVKNGWDVGTATNAHQNGWDATSTPPPIGGWDSEPSHNLPLKTQSDATSPKTPPREDSSPTINPADTRAPTSQSIPHPPTQPQNSTQDPTITMTTTPAPAKPEKAQLPTLDGTADDLQPPAQPTPSNLSSTTPSIPPATTSNDPQPPPIGPRTPSLSAGATRGGGGGSGKRGAPAARSRGRGARKADGRNFAPAAGTGFPTRGENQHSGTVTDNGSPAAAENGDWDCRGDDGQGGGGGDGSEGKKGWDDSEAAGAESVAW